MIAVATLPILSALSFAGGKSIYGTDDRIEYFAATQDMKTISDSVASFWKAGSVEVLNPWQVKLNGASLGDYIMSRHNGVSLCPGEKFREQPTGAFCSSSLVGEDLVLTAGHCIANAASCAATKIVFGYAVKQEGEAAVTTLPSSEVYSCSRVVKRFRNRRPAPGRLVDQSSGADYGLIQLDRKVTGHKPLPINRKADIKNGDSVVIIGHPLGLPLKVAGGATVRVSSTAGYFMANLDAFSGNSGSPVFNAKTRKIEGVLVRGAVDFAFGLDIKYPYLAPPPYFVHSPNCIKMAVYGQTEDGEDVSNISALSPFIPEPGFLEDPAPIVETAADSPEVKDMDSSAMQSTAIVPFRAKGVISFD